MTAPKIGVAPKILAAENPMSTGKNVNPALENRFTISAMSFIAGNASTRDLPGTNIPWAVRILLMPINRPDATRAGRMGTNTSARVLSSFCTGFIFLAACCFNSSFVISVMWAMAINSPYTLLTIPVPRIIWNWPPLLKLPFTSSMFSKAFRSTLESSFKTSRSLVAQWAALTILPSPPTQLNISRAAFPYFSSMSFLLMSLSVPIKVLLYICHAPPKEYFVTLIRASPSQSNTMPSASIGV